MPVISINLLPTEFKSEEIKRAKFYKIQAAGVSIVLLMIFLATLTVVLRVLQSNNISQYQARLARNEQKVSQFKNTQASLLLLKNRLTAINQYLGIPSGQTQMYKLVAGLLPASVLVSSFSIDSLGQVTILATAADGASLDSLISNLTSKESNQGKISQVSLETIGRGKDGVFRVTFKIKPK